MEKNNPQFITLPSRSVREFFDVTGRRIRRCTRSAGADFMSCYGVSVRRDAFSFDGAGAIIFSIPAVLINTDVSRHQLQKQWS
jgi:hypothetical protein